MSELLPPAHAPRISEIQLVVARWFNIPMADMVSDRRDMDLTRPRQIAMYLARHLTPKSFPSIGRAFGRDHSTVIHAVRVVDARRKGEQAIDLSVIHCAGLLARKVAERIVPSEEI